MKIIVLDDNPDELDAFDELLEEYYPKSEVCLTDSLLDFHEFLFESVAEERSFDKIIIDAQLEKPNDIREEYYIDFLKAVNIDDESILKGDMLGWWYYDKYLRKVLPTELLRNVLIKTGFSKTVFTLAPKTQGYVNILNKGDPDYLHKLKEFLNN